MRWFWQHRKRNVLFLYSFPHTEDFVRYKKELDKCIVELQKVGAEVYGRISQELLAKANKYDVIIIIAHRDDTKDALVLADGLVKIDTLVSWLPKSYNGIIDFSSCYGVKAVERIKKHCPNCLVQFFANQVHLKLRLVMYPYVVNYFVNNPKISYNEAYSQVLEAIRNEVVPQTNSAEETKLGNQDQHLSSVYAPQAIKKEEFFQVQIFFYRKGDEEQIEFQAKRSDPMTGLIETQFLPFRLKKTDILTVQISFISPDSRWIHIEGNTYVKQCRWNGMSAHFQFAAIVLDKFTKDSFVTKIIMDVNGEPIGECFFTVKIREKKDVIPVEYEILPHDYIKEKDYASHVIIEKLTATQAGLMNEIEKCDCDIKRERLVRDLHISKTCLEYYKNGFRRHEHNIKSIFISSTSDLKPYREVLRKIIDRKDKLYAEMYEKWPQGESTPRDECCRRVLDSDVVVCLLGANYGSEEPCWGMSMTEIECQTALKSGIPLLVFILDPLNESNEAPPKPERQRQIIEELRSKRTLRLFSTKHELKEAAIDDLYEILIKMAENIH